MNRHKWKWYGKDSSFCVKCGFYKCLMQDRFNKRPCTMSDAVWKQNFPHMFEKQNGKHRCVKCGLLRSEIIKHYIVLHYKFNNIKREHEPCSPWIACCAYPKRHTPSIKIPCTMSHKEGYIKSVIE